jgi:phosphoenolpyruvate carboxykinase (ATP)
VPPEVLDPASSWPSKKDYMNKYRQLASRFIDNFKKFEAQSPKDVKAAGPKI